MVFHPTLSPSPLEKAFCYVASQSSSYGGGSPFRDNGDDDAESDLPPYWLSPPEISLLRSAEENPLEYTLAEADDAVSYLRILLKMLNQVTVNASETVTSQRKNSLMTNSRSIYYQSSGNNGSTNNNTLRSSSSEEERILTLDTPMFSEDEAFNLYHGSSNQRKKLVVAHYCVAKIYEIICVSLDARGAIPSVSKLFHGKDDATDKNETEDYDFHTIHLKNDEWRPLLKILYSRSADEYTKRGSALILAYILKTGCEMERKLSKIGITGKPKADEDLLDLFSDEHKTPLSPQPNTTLIADTMQSFIEWLTSRLQRSGSYASLGVITPTLGVLMSTTKEARIAFVQSGGIGYISRHLRAKRQKPLPSYSPLLRPLQTTTNSIRSNQQRRHDPLPVTLPPSDTTSTRKRVSASKRAMTPSSPPSTARTSKTQKPIMPITNPFNSNSSISQSNSFGSSGSSNLGLSELDLLSSLPSTENLSKNLSNILSSASEVAETAVTIARSAAPEGLVSFAASKTSAAMTNGSPQRSKTNRTNVSSSSSSSSVQQLYDLVFCLWCLSLDCSTDESVFKRFSRDGAIPALAHLLKKAPREKVLRMTLACLRSLSILKSDSNEEPFITEMIGCGVLKSLDTVKLRRWNDDDLEEDLEILQKLLSERTEELTQWSTYEAQITTGILRWDEMFHTHEFFRANARHMEGATGDFAPLKILVKLLYSNTTSGKLRSSGRADEISYVGLNEINGWDEEDIRDDEISETLAVCLFDIGEFARNYPNGKSVLGSRCGIGAKGLIMQYVHHPRDMVREQALLCASKMLVKNWMVSFLRQCAKKSLLHIICIRF